MKSKLLLLILPLFLFVKPNVTLSQHGTSLDGSVAYDESFKSFNYTSNKAQKGGKLILHDNGSYDKLNPFSLKGSAPYLLEELTFDPLCVASLDEPFSLYGLIAKQIILHPNKLSVMFVLNDEAKFSDGSRITAEDVGFSLDYFKSDQVHPSYNFYYQDISGYEIIDSETIRFKFSTPNRELHMIAAQMKVLSKNSFSQPVDVKTQKKQILISSGPYVVKEFKFGKMIQYVRNDNYWAKSHPTRKNQYNFDEIIVKYYKDRTIALEAFKGGEFDFISIHMAKQWARDMKGKKFDNQILLKKGFPHSNNAGIQGFVMNSRKQLFRDRKVRKAISLALDFRWVNDTLFHNQYTRNSSFFSNSYLAAKGLPNREELNLLNKFKSILPLEVFETPLDQVFDDKKRNMRQNLLQARQLLLEAGWKIQNNMLQKDDVEFRFEILLISPTFERIMAPFVKNLEKLGMQVSYRTVDSALYVQRLKSFDFDMIVTTYGQSQSPGNELRNYFHSESVDRVGSNNFAGIQSQVIDSLVEQVIYSKTKKELTTACHALDRVLWHSHYIVPNWFLDFHRLGYHKKIKRPDRLPLYYYPFDLLMTWWIESEPN